MLREKPCGCCDIDCLGRLMFGLIFRLSFRSAPTIIVVLEFVVYSVSIVFLSGTLLVARIILVSFLWRCLSGFSGILAGTAGACGTTLSSLTMTVWLICGIRRSSSWLGSLRLMYLMK